MRSGSNSTGGWGESKEKKFYKKGKWRDYTNIESWNGTRLYLHRCCTNSRLQNYLEIPSRPVYRILHPREAAGGEWFPTFCYEYEMTGISWLAGQNSIEEPLNRKYEGKQGHMCSVSTRQTQRISPSGRNQLCHVLVCVSEAIHFVHRLEMLISLTKRMQKACKLFLIPFWSRRISRRWIPTGWLCLIMTDSI